MSIFSLTLSLHSFINVGEMVVGLVSVDVNTYLIVPFSNLKGIS